MRWGRLAVVLIVFSGCSDDRGDDGGSTKGGSAGTAAGSSGANTGGGAGEGTSGDGGVAGATGAGAAGEGTGGDAGDAGDSTGGGAGDLIGGEGGDSGASGTGGMSGGGGSTTGGSGGSVAGGGGTSGSGAGTTGAGAAGASGGGASGGGASGGGASGGGASSGGASGGGASGGGASGGGVSGGGVSGGGVSGGGASGGGASGSGGGPGNDACAQGFASNESCNGVDDDCDGEVDELGTFTCGVGACARTVPACSGGNVSACVPLAPATTTDGCNGVDDDCDGAVDEDCTGCVPVSPTGNDEMALANNAATPFATVQAAIDYADTHRTVVPRVCVAAGATCGETATFTGPSGADLTMRNGVSVLGNYESTAWTRCTTSTTRLAPQTGRGVVFPASVTSQTVLDGFAIDRFVNTTTTAAVTVDGATDAILSNLAVTSPVPAMYWPPPVATASYGVNVVNGGVALVFRSRIDAGLAVTESVAVRAAGSRVSVQDNCPIAPDSTTGRCSAACGAAGPAIVAGWKNLLYAAQKAVVLEDSPGSRVERSAVCSSYLAFGGSAAMGEAIEVSGASEGNLVRGNNIAMECGLLQDASPPGCSPQSVTIGLQDCGGAAPWIVDNHALMAAGNRARTIRSLGDCHPVIESNLDIRHSVSRQGDVKAVHCDSQGGVPSRCVVTRNREISGRIENVTFGGGFTIQSSGTGITCANGSCARIDQNRITGAAGAIGGQSLIFQSTGIGIELHGADAFIDRNVVYGACLPTLCVLSATGISVSAGRPRIQNNQVFGACALEDRNWCLDASRSTSVGLQVGAAASAARTEVHSNYLAATASATSQRCNACSTLPCEPGTLYYGAAVSGPGGVFRNNILSAGSCTDGAAFSELSTSADPSVFENNALHAASSGIHYFDERTSYLHTAMAIDALTDMTVSGTLDTPCTKSTDWHLVSGSACIDRGTTTDAPLLDMDGHLRDATPDIGPDEYVP